MSLLLFDGRERDGAEGAGERSDSIRRSRGGVLVRWRSRTIDFGKDIIRDVFRGEGVDDIWRKVVD